MKKLIKLFLVIFWMTIIFLFSSDPAVKSTEKSDSVVVSFISSITHKEYSEEEKVLLTSKYSLLVRKVAHIVEYGILGILVCLLLMEFTDKNIIISSIIICLIYALSDEVHQLFVKGRSGQLIDVFIDSIGFIQGIIYVFIIKKSLRKRNV